MSTQTTDYLGRLWINKHQSKNPVGANQRTSLAPSITINSDPNPIVTSSSPTPLLNADPSSPNENSARASGGYDNYQLPPPNTIPPELPPAPPFSTQHPLNTEQFLAIVEEVRLAIDQGIYPQRIQQGSSGSYFCRNRQGEVVAVFKPKNEEPYGHLNPKWTKWLHKTCCPCCFGRSCLIPNLGYLSEAAASLVDRHLGLDVVPRTEIISLASPTFHYSYRDRQNALTRGQYPTKIGSFQLFMHGFMDATKFLREGPEMLRDGRLPRDEQTGNLDRSMQTQFQQQFEKMVVLDYIIRNTDRGLDNWMVRLDISVDDGVVGSSGGGNDPAHNMSQNTIDQSVSSYDPRQFDVFTTDSMNAIKSIADSSLPGGLDARSRRGPVSLATPHSTIDRRTVAAQQPAVVGRNPAHEIENDTSGGGGSDSEHRSGFDGRPSRNLGSSNLIVQSSGGALHLNSSLGSFGMNNSSLQSTGEASGNMAAFPTRSNSENALSNIDISLQGAANGAPADQHASDHHSEDLVKISPPTLYLAAIDNGLAFPFKHPDKFRSYPYGWSYLPASRVPFTLQIRQRLLAFLTNPRWWQNLVGDLRILFSCDPDFDVNLFRRQIAVMKGQVYNLVQILKRQEAAMNNVESPVEGLAVAETGSSGQSQHLTPVVAGISSTSSSPVPANPMNPLLPSNPISQGQVAGETQTQQRSPLAGLIGSKVPSTSNSAQSPAVVWRGTPFELVNESPCLIWEDEDVRDLAAGVFGPELTGKGLLGTIIGGMETLSHAVMGGDERESRDRSRSPARQSRTAPTSTAEEENNYGEFLTSPTAMVNGIPVYENFPMKVGYRQQQQQRRDRTGSSRDNLASGGGGGAGGSASKLDAFKGRVITFVKNQPWFKSW